MYKSYNSTASNAQTKNELLLFPKSKIISKLILFLEQNYPRGSKVTPNDGINKTSKLIFVFLYI